MNHTLKWLIPPIFILTLVELAIFPGMVLAGFVITVILLKNVMA